MKFKLHDVVTLKKHADEDAPMVIIANGFDGRDWLLICGGLLIKADECDICLWKDRDNYKTK